MEFKKYFKKLKWYFYFETIAWIAAIVNLMNAIIYFPVYIWIFIVIILVLSALIVITARRSRLYKESFDEKSKPEDVVLERLFDRYGRRLLNWILIGFFLAGTFILTMIRLGVNSKLSELLSTFNGRLFGFEIASFFIVKNMMLGTWLSKIHPYEHAPLLKKTRRRIILTSVIYWLIALGLYFAFEYVFVLDIGPFLASLYFLGGFLFNFRGINRFVYQKTRYQRIILAGLAAVVLVVGGYSFLSRDIWLTQPYINTRPNLYGGKSEITYDEETGIYTITKKNDEEFQILQLTDIHLGGGVLSYDKDIKALKACYSLIARTSPDLVIVTGDLTYPVGLSSFSFNNTAPVQQFAAFMRNLGEPWAFTYGNHDTESYAATSKSNLDELYKKLSWKTSKTLLYPYVQPDITGRSNQLIEIRNADGTLNQGIFLIDSNAYTGEGFNKYDYIHDDQVEWYKEQVLRLNNEAGHTVPTQIYFHIPLQQYRDAYELYEAGSDEVQYFFGSNDETMMNKVCCSEYPSKLFDTAKELGSTTGFFCGHDHYNNMSLEYQGMRLTYGMSIDYLAMPGIARDTKQRGGTLITIDADGKMGIKQVPLN